MQHRNLAGLIAAVIVLAAVLASSALAGGEPKNEWPFTHSIDGRTTQAATGIAQQNPAVRGEPKNGLPFTRVVTVTVAANRSGFDWSSGAIGSGAGLGVALVGAGLVLATRKSPRTT